MFLITNNHHIPFKTAQGEELGSCSHCHCKDLKAMLDEGHSLNVDMKIFKTMEQENEEMRSNLDKPHNKCRNTSGGVID